MILHINNFVIIAIENINVMLYTARSTNRLKTLYVDMEREIYFPPNKHSTDIHQREIRVVFASGRNIRHGRRGRERGSRGLDFAKTREAERLRCARIVRAAKRTMQTMAGT